MPVVNTPVKNRPLYCGSLAKSAEYIFAWDKRGRRSLPAVRFAPFDSILANTIAMSTYGRMVFVSFGFLRSNFFDCQHSRRSWTNGETYWWRLAEENGVAEVDWSHQ